MSIIRMQGGVSMDVHLVAFTFFLQHEQLYLFSPVNLSTSKNYFKQSLSDNCFAYRFLGIDSVSEQFSVYVLD